VTAEENSSFYHVMQIAAEQDLHYVWVFEGSRLLTPSLLILTILIA
jgi:hypothetical protein